MSQLEPIYLESLDDDLAFNWDDSEDDYHPYDCCCEDCLQNHPERDILYGDGEYFDWDGSEAEEAAEHRVHLTAFGASAQALWDKFHTFIQPLLARIGGR